MDPAVIKAMGTLATSHVDPGFIDIFGNTIELLRKVFYSSGQPIVMAGSGTLMWDMVASNLVCPKDKVLVINTGVFGDWFGECLQVYGAQVHHLSCGFGYCPTLQEIEDVLKQQSFKLITITQVDTSTSVLVDVEQVSKLVKRVCPSTLIVVDGVCSAAAEQLKMDEWGLDVILTASQKALGVPPGLGVMLVSKRALDIGLNRPGPPTTYFCSFKKWIPIMTKYEQRKPSYFATPAVQLIMALHTSLKQILEQGMNDRFMKHCKASDQVKNSLEQWGLKLVAKDRKIAAHTLTAVYYPLGINAQQFLQKVGQKGVILAGGLHPQHAAEYFRIGHMNVSACDEHLKHVEITMNAIKESLVECGYKF